MGEPLTRSIEQEPANDVLTHLKGIQTALGQLVETIRPPEQAMFPIYATAQATHIRMRVDQLVLSGTVPGATITLHVGNRTWDLHATSADAIGPLYAHVLPFPVLIDRGIDVWISGIDTFTAWFTYRPE